MSGSLAGRPCPSVKASQRFLQSRGIGLVPQPLSPSLQPPPRRVPGPGTHHAGLWRSPSAAFPLPEGCTPDPAASSSCRRGSPCVQTAKMATRIFFSPAVYGGSHFSTSPLSSPYTDTHTYIHTQIIYILLIQLLLLNLY